MMKFYKGLCIDRFKLQLTCVLGMTKPDKPIPILVQQPDESDVMFMSRVSHATNDVINEVCRNFLKRDYYQIDLLTLLIY